MASPFDQVDYDSWLAGSTESARITVPLVVDAISPQSVVDVGCGLGAWLAVFREHGVDDLLGYDGPWIDRSLLLITPGEFRAIDLEEPFVETRRFDLALCLEVAQYLEQRHSERFVESLTSLADIVLFSSAIPGQPGVHHVNEQWPRYWAEHFDARGYVASDPFRGMLWEQPDVKWWFAQNMVCYARPEALDSRPVLAGSRCAAPLPLVHPGCLEHYVEELRAAQAPRRRRWR